MAEVGVAPLPRRMLDLVKFEHTIFALPFAWAGMLLAMSAHDAWSWLTAAWITVAMVGARTLAMTLNRIIDRAIDARNPRTASRELPAGTVTLAQALGLALVSMVVYLVAVWQLADITHVLWPIPVLLFVLYPYTKRFTWLCHVVLGLTVGLAPLAAWIAVTNSFDPVPVVLWLAIAAWVAGFDVIYATHDVDFDRAHGLHSLPSRFGVAAGLMTTRVLHVLTVAGLAWVGYAASLGFPYWIALAVVAALLTWENSIVSPQDLSRANAAFFTVNGIIGVVFFLGVVAALVA